MDNDNSQFNEPNQDLLAGQTGEGGPAVCSENQSAPAEQEDFKPPGFLELIYGVLFDPVNTFRRIADSPPLGRVVLIFSLIVVLGGAVAWCSMIPKLSSGNVAEFYQGSMAEVFRAIVPVVILGVIIFSFVKWFLASGLLHLLSDLIGGSGRAVGVLAATGLASLPALLFLPVQILAVFFRGSRLFEVFNLLILLVVIVWGFILVIIGIRETQRLSTGTAVLVALIPPVSIIVIFILFLVLAVTVLAPAGNLIK